MIRNLGFLAREVLGINRRNGEFMARHNPRHLFQTVDHKLKTKAALLAVGVPVAETLAVYRFQYETRRFAQDSRAWGEFVVKPAQGAGGEGVLVVTGYDGNGFLTVQGRGMPVRQLESHLSDILGGVFSLNQRYDEALVERCLHAHPLLAGLSFRGLPDIRVILYRGVPLMAMLRLATQQSKGRANLHAGGLGVGVDLTTGETVAAIAGKRWIHHHPDTDLPLLGVGIPQWSELLLTATRCADAVALGYLGVDLTLDVERGACVLELNARPGLAIQLANRQGLRPLLTAVDQKLVPGLPLHERMQLGQDIARLVVP